MQTPSLMDNEIIHLHQSSIDTVENQFAGDRKVEDLRMHELLDYMENYCNSKISTGLQMIVQKIIVLVDEQVKYRVTEEMAEWI